MSKKIKAIIATGGTGGHVFPGYNLATHLKEQNYDVELVTDKRGFKYLIEIKDIKITIMPSSPIVTKSIFYSILSCIKIFYSFFRSFLFLIFSRPKVIFGMGGYASFPMCFAASILRIRFIIYENNLVIGKANKYLLPFTEKILVTFKDIEGVPDKYRKKIIEIGNIIKKKYLNFYKETSKTNHAKKINLLVLGGSQAAKIFAEILPDIFLKCHTQGIQIKVFQQCLKNQSENLRLFYQKNKIDFEIFNFSNNLETYYVKTHLAITRAGSSVLAELTNINTPFISIPLPTSADNHQFKNALFYEKKKIAFLIEEKDLNDKLFYTIKEIYEKTSILDEIRHNQRQYSDKNVYKNINKFLKNYI